MTASMPAATDQRASEYSQLMAEVRQARLLDRSAARYLPRLAVLSVMVIAGVTAFVWLGQSWWQLVVAAYFAVVFAQLGFLGHDAGHQQIFRSRRWNDLLGVLVSDLGIGLSYGWWVDKHTLHHRHPNEVGRDPDVKRNVLAWNAQQADQQRGILRFVARHQAAFFFPLLAFEALNLQVGGLRTLIAKPRGRGVEIALLVAHAVGCIALVLLVLPPVQAIAFVSVQQALLGLYLGSSFAPNHKGMPMPDENDAGLGFLRRQVMTSRNVRGGRGIATIFGGLNYQIEHHLFPSMPSRNLRRVQPMVKSFCAAHGVSYTETGLFDSYARALRYLRGVRPGVATQV